MNGGMPCPVGGCGRAVTRGLLMCASCWMEVTHDLRRDIETTWRTYSRTHRDKDWHGYKAAFDAAVDHVREQNKPSAFRVPPTICPTCGSLIRGEGRCWNPTCSPAGGGGAA